VCSCYLLIFVYSKKVVKRRYDFLMVKMSISFLGCDVLNLLKIEALEFEVLSSESDNDFLSCDTV
jgi:hypothetical protein